jgi:hypothetical protein
VSTRIGGSEFRLDASCAKLASWTNNNGLLVNRNEFMLKTLVYDEDLTRSPDSNEFRQIGKKTILLSKLGLLGAVGKLEFKLGSVRVAGGPELIPIYVDTESPII